MKPIRIALLACLTMVAFVSCKTSDAGPSLALKKRRVEKALPKLAREIRTAPTNAGAVSEALENYLRDNPQAYGAAFAVDPSRAGKLFSPYVYRHKGNFVRMNLDDPKYNYPLQQWYAQPKQLNHAVWSDPYFDDGGGNITMITYSIPVFSDGKFLGIITTDLPYDSK